MQLLKKYKLPIIGASVTILFALALWLIPQWQVAYSDQVLQLKDRIQLENEARRTLAQIVGGAFIILGAYLAWRRVTIAEQTVLISQEEQITERFTQAIEQLGNEKLQVRLGGIYALERIAKDSEKDYWPIIEVLTAYIRESSIWNEGQPIQKLPADIRAILTVLGRRAHTYKNGEDLRLELGQIDLRRVFLSEAHFEGTNLRGAHLEESILDKIHLEGADLYGAHLDVADLRESNLQQADLRDAHLHQADFEFANLIGADFQGADLSGVNFRGANLEGVNLKNANLEGADFHGANLTGADMTDANMKGASFIEADLHGAWYGNPFAFRDSIVDYTTKPEELQKQIAKAERDYETLMKARGKRYD